MKQKTLYIYILLGIFICLFGQYSTAQNLGGTISIPTAPSLSLKVGSRDSVCLSYSQGATPQGKNYATLHISQPLRVSVTVKSTSFIKNNEEGKPCRNHVATFEPTLSETEGMTTISYYDGFGKEQEYVQVGFVESNKNVVTYQEYDPWGRKGRTWSPMSVDAMDGDEFTPLDSIKGQAGDTEPFGYPEYQASPISLETKRFGDGKAWHQAGKAICMDYFTNKEGNDSLNCMHLEVSMENENVSIKRTDNYRTGDLMVTRTTDEDGRATFTFKDIFGRTLLTRRKLTVNGKKNFLDTYYIYDRIDQLVAVVPPALTKFVENDFLPKEQVDAYAYAYKYDELGRTTKAYYGMRRFSEFFEYDLMGNVTKLVRGGNNDNGAACNIDNLTLKYRGNQLLKVTDSNEGPYYKGAFHFVDGADEDMEYAYDANGNMAMDLNKGITSITYNDLNLPGCITFKLKDDLTQTETEKKIEYFYDSDGGKRAVLYSNDDYIAYTENRVFENDKLKYLLFEGGYATFENGEKNPTFHFYIKDHLGNNRIVADAQGNVEQENHYYPSGTLIMGSKFTQDITSSQRYRFGGKELDRMYGLDWNDFGARMHNPLLNCWTTMDPLCEKYYDISPYVYCNNDPVNIFDPNGTRIYLLFYSYGNSDPDINSDFYASALTRYYDITNSKDYDAKKDYIFLLGFNDLAKIKDTAEDIINKYSKQYGKTAEVDFYTHGGFDGPIGTIDNNDYFEYSHDQYQMSLEGWNNINFNWEKNAGIYFYGCNTANTNYKHPISFSQKISKLENFRNINVYGQASSVYFSNNNYSYQKRKNIPIIHKNNSISFPRTYMISPIWGRYCFINGRLFPMTHYMNNQQI